MEQDGDWKAYFKTSIEGDIYDKAYALAQLRVAGPAVAAIEATTDYLMNRCDEVDLTIQDVSNVLAHTDPGSLLLTTMDTADIFGEEVSLWEFDDSCMKVIGCYYYDYLQWQNPPVDIDDLSFTNELADTCKWLVVDLYGTMQMRASSHESMRDANFGDELFVNGNAVDSPYDLLVDIEKIGDLLFSHNDDPAEIHFYDMVPKADYVDNDPNELTPYETEQPWWEEDDLSKRRVPSIGIPLEPIELPDGTYPPEDVTPVQNTQLQQLDQPAPIGWLDAPAPGGTIQNNECVAPSPEPAPIPIMEYAEEEFEQTHTYNDELDLDQRVAIALWAMLLPALQEEIVDDPNAVQRRSDPEVIEQIDVITSDEVLGKEWLEDLEELLKECVKEYTDHDERAFEKVIWKTLTQPTELSLCAMQAMCKEIWGDVGTNPNMGDYRIKVCKQPSRRAYGVVNNQPVVSIEEVVDEINNACLWLKESGQLIEHNKTKDQWDHGLMRVKLGEKIAFSLSVSFATVRDEEDITAEKRKRAQKNEYLQKTILWITDDLSFENERNKYLVIARSQPLTKDIDVWLDAQKKWDAYADQRDVADGIQKDKAEQITHYAQLLDQLDAFLEYNMHMRWTINDYTHSLNASWQGEQKEYTKKS